ncbi:4Fe-4S binding protein [Deferrisoma camini]|uniref:4Fe-4S binding protein n=1 Tax=Deferrisoma camini TaxID=1035120 RepID=UPI00046D0D7E|nr:4Fe-4S binding protein [Deferrisoma camini]
MRETIRAFARELGADDVGFAAAGAYRSPRSPGLDSILPGAQTLVVLAYRELSSCESPNPQIAMAGRLEVMEFARSCNYRLARHLESACGARAVTVPPSYPLEMSAETKGAVGDVSLRHAAVAAGLGAFGRHNLVIHPRMGTRVVFTAVLTDLALPGDRPVDDTLCTGCNRCVEACPGNALAQEGRTDLMACIRNSQPYGIGAAISFWGRYGAADPKDRKAMVRDPHFWRLYQAGSIGFQYFCFRCMAVCPACRGRA